MKCMNTTKRTKNIHKKCEEIHKRFEMHKKELDLLDLNDYVGSLKKLKAIGVKINQDKKSCYQVIKDLENTEKNAANQDKKKKIAGVATSGVGLVASIITGIFTGGATVAVYLALAGGNAVVCGINIARLVKLMKQLKKYKETKMKEIEYYDQISKVLNEEIAKKEDEIRKAFSDKYSPQLDDF